MIDNDPIFESVAGSSPPEVQDILAEFRTKQYALGKLPERPTTTIFDKIKAAAALENVTGRALWKGINAFSDPLSDYGNPRFFDARTKRFTDEFNLDQWIRDNENNLNTDPLGKTVLENYSAGLYDRMSSKEFFAAVGSDIVERSMRNDLEQATTGSGIVDFGAAVVGSAIDPVTIFGGKALLNTAGYLNTYRVAKNLKTGLADAEMLSLMSKAKPATDLTKLTFGQAIKNTAIESGAIGLVQQGGLLALDPEHRTMEGFVENIGLNIATDVILGGLFNLPKIGSKVRSPREYLAKKMNEVMDEADASPVNDLYSALHAVSERTDTNSISSFEKKAAQNYASSVETSSIRSDEQLINDLNAELQNYSPEQNLIDSLNNDIVAGDKAKAEVSSKMDALNNDLQASLTEEIASSPEAKMMDSVNADLAANDKMNVLNQDLAQVAVGDIKDTSTTSKDYGAVSTESGASGRQMTFFNGESDAIAVSRAKVKPTPKPVSSAFSEEDKKLLENILKNQEQAIARPIDTAKAMAQLDRIANRNTQVFNYGRLDSMGLKQVKIEQPLQAIINQLQATGVDANMAQLLSELKKLQPEQAGKALESHPDLSSTYRAWRQVFKEASGGKETPETIKAAVDATVELGEQLSARAKTYVGYGKNVPTGPVSLAYGQHLNSELDYFPDRSNDAIRKASVWLAEKAQNIPFLKNFIDPSTPEEVRGLFNLHQRFTMRRYLFSDNPIHSALANTMLDPLLPMKAQTSGQIRSKFSVERMNRLTRQRSRLAQGMLFNSFSEYARTAEPELASLLDKASLKTDQHSFLSAKYLAAAETYYGNVEKARLLLKDKTWTNANREQLFKDALNNFINDQQKLDGYVKALNKMDDLGLLRANEDAKLSRWMTTDQRRVFNQSMSIKIHSTKPDGSAVTLDDLNNFMLQLFEKEAGWSKIKAGDFPSDRWKGLERFIQTEQFDETTGQFIKKFGVVTKDELLAATTDSAKHTELVRRITDEFNENWGLVPISKLKHLSDSIETLSDRTYYSLSTMNTIQKVSRFFERYEMAEQLTDRLRELESLRLRRTYSPEDIKLIQSGSKQAETIFSSKIRQFDAMRNRLYQALTPEASSSDGVLDIQTPEMYHFWTKYSSDAIDSIVAEANDLFVRSDWKGLSKSASAKKIAANKIESDSLGEHLKEMFGLTSKVPVDPVGSAIIDFTQSMVLGKAGMTQLIDVAKSLATQMSYQGPEGVASLMNQFAGLFSSARKSGLSEDNLGFVLESMQTHLEDVQSMIARRYEDSSGAFFFDAGPESKLGKFTKAHRWMIGKASGMEIVNDAAKLASYSTANSMLGGKEGLINRARRIVDIMRSEGLNAQQAVAKLQRTLPVDLNDYHAFGKIAANLSHDEIIALDELLKTLPVSKVKMTGRLGTPGISVDSFSLPQNLSEADRNAASNLLRKYSNLVDYWIEREMLNVPTGSSNLLIAQPQGFLNRAMTLFLRTTIAALDNQGVGQSNISLFQRIPMLAYMTSVSFGVYCLKTYLAGGEEGFQRNVLDKIDSGPMGNAQLVAQALDYSGYLGIISSKALNFALDAGSESFYQRANAGEYQLMSPVQSFGIQAGRSLVNAAGSGFDVENLSSMDRRTLRKLFGLGLFDTTFGQLIFDKGLNNKMTEHTQIENFSNWLYPENDN